MHRNTEIYTHLSTYIKIYNIYIDISIGGYRGVYAPLERHSRTYNRKIEQNPMRNRNKGRHCNKSRKKEKYK